MSSKKKNNTVKRESRTVKKVSEPLMQDGAFLLNANRPSLAEWVGLGFGLLMLTVFADFICSTLYTDMNYIKWVCMIVMLGLFALGLVIALFENYAQGKIHLKSITKTSILNTITVPQMFIIGYVLFAFISALASEYGSDVWVGQGRYEGFYSVFMYSSIFFLGSLFCKYHKALIYSLAGALIFFSLIAFAQYLGKNPFGLYPSGYYFTNSLFLSTMGNIDVVAGFAALFLPVMFAAYTLFEGKWRYYLILPAYVTTLYTQMVGNADSGKFGLIVALVVAIPILFTNTKRVKRIFELFFATAVTMLLEGCMLVTETAVNVTVKWSTDVPHFKIYVLLAIVSVIGWFIFHIKETDFSAKANNGFFGLLQKAHLLIDKVNFTPKQIRTTVVGAVVVVSVAVIIFIFTYNGTSEIIVQLSHFLHGQLDDLAGSGRGFVWKKTILLIKENFWLGSGPDTFKEAFMPYSNMYAEMYKSGVYFDYAHNDYLQIGSNLGIPALVCYMGFLISLCVRAIKRIKYNPLIIPFGLAVLGYSVHVFFSFSVPILSPLFWAMAGMLDKVIRMTPTENAENLLDPVKAE